MHPFFLMPFANRSMISVLFFFMLASPWAFAQAETAEAPQSVEMTMKKMMSAIEADSLADFVSSGDAAFQAGMTKELFDTVNRTVAPRLKQGYTTTFLTRQQQQGFDVYLWKMAFKDGKDDALVTMAVKEGKVGGFWLR